jgi:ADP-ribose pyrophosphatase YjhB (NUDIX family)
MTYDVLPAASSWQEFRVGQGILVKDQSVLLCANRWYSNKPPVWTLPGGRAEFGESVGDALVREFAEETGLVIELNRLAYVSEARSTVSRRLFLTCAFVVESLGGDLAPVDTTIAELRFVPIHEFDSYLPSPSLGTPLRYFLQEPEAAARYWFFPDYSPE